MSKFSSTSLLHFIHKRFLNTISTSTLPSPSFSTIQFLTNSCGLSSGSPTSGGRKLQFDEKHIHQYEAIIGFLKSHGFQYPQIAKLISRRPSILQSKVSNNLKPKFEFLQEIGFVGPLLHKLLLSTPWVLGSSLDSQLKPSFFVIKEMLESDEQVIAAISRFPSLLIYNLKEEKLRNVADFCFNTAKLDRETLITYPMFFNTSLDKRLYPRYKVLEVLKVKNLLKNTKIARVILLRGEKEFMEKYVVKHLDEIPNLMDIYRGNVAAETKSVL